jgi:hypothetical protein
MSCRVASRGAILINRIFTLAPAEPPQYFVQPVDRNRAARLDRTKAYFRREIHHVQE